MSRKYLTILHFKKGKLFDAGSGTKNVRDLGGADPENTEKSPLPLIIFASVAPLIVNFLQDVATSIFLQNNILSFY